MRALKRRDYPLRFGKQLEPFERLGVGDRDVLRTSRVLEPRMLRADTRIIEPGGNRMGLANLPHLVLEQVRAVAVQHADAAGVERRGMTRAVEPKPGGLDAYHPYVGVLDKRIEKSDSVRAAIHARDQYVGQAAFLYCNLAARLASDNGLEVTYDHRVRMGSGGRTNQVVGIANGRDPVAQRFIERVFEAPGAGVDRDDLCAQQLHPENVERLPLDVDAPHEHFTFAFEQRSHRGGRHSMLSGAGFRRDARLVHPHREQRLSERIVNLVRAGMAEVFALDVNLRAAELGGQVGGKEERSRASDKLARIALQVLAELEVAARVLVRQLQLQQGRHQGLGDVAASIQAEVSVPIRKTLHSR